MSHGAFYIENEITSYCCSTALESYMVEYRSPATQARRQQFYCYPFIISQEDISHKKLSGFV